MGTYRLVDDASQLRASHITEHGAASLRATRSIYAGKKLPNLILNLSSNSCFGLDA